MTAGRGSVFFISKWWHTNRHFAVCFAFGRVHCFFAIEHQKKAEMDMMPK